MAALSKGAKNIIIKPFNTERLLEAIKIELYKSGNETVPAIMAGNPPKTLEGGAAKEQIEEKKELKPTLPDFDEFTGNSPIMLKLYEQIKSLSKSTAPVFITGESGTGKELCARSIHNNSVRKDRPFVPINCAAIPRDLLEAELFGHTKGAFTGAISIRKGAVSVANGGTLFLDEIAEMPKDMQTKLLRFLQNYSFRKVGSNEIEHADVRIICATNKNPLQEVINGSFREDLFYRLHVLPIYMPPLRKRDKDIIKIANSLIRTYAKEENKEFCDISEEAERIMLDYSWPGNIRQLQNILRQIIVMNNGKRITASMLPNEIVKATSEKEAKMSPSRTNFIIQPLARTEREVIEHTIDYCDGNILKAAALLDISPSTIYRKKIQWEKL
jgi:DNA-binding NtrC family response regulator